MAVQQELQIARNKDEPIDSQLKSQTISSWHFVLCQPSAPRSYENDCKP
jgi:hypothetical protein